MLCWLLSGEVAVLSAAGFVPAGWAGTFCREAPWVPGREGQAQPKCRAKHIAAPDVKRTRDFAKKPKEGKEKKKWQKLDVPVRSRVKAALLNKARQVTKQSTEQQHIGETGRRPGKQEPPDTVSRGAAAAAFLREPPHPWNAWAAISPPRVPWGFWHQREPSAGSAGLSAGNPTPLPGETPKREPLTASPGPLRPSHL